MCAFEYLGLFYEMSSQTLLFLFLFESFRKHVAKHCWLVTQFPMLDMQHNMYPIVSQNRLRFCVPVESKKLNSFKVQICNAYSCLVSMQINYVLHLYFQSCFTYRFQYWWLSLRSLQMQSQRFSLIFDLMRFLTVEYAFLQTPFSGSFYKIESLYDCRFPCIFSLLRWWWDHSLLFASCMFCQDDKTWSCMTFTCPVASWKQSSSCKAMHKVSPGFLHLYLYFHTACLRGVTSFRFPLYPIA